MIKASILEDAAPDGPFGEQEAECVGTEAVSEFGVDGLLELGFNADTGDAPENVLEQATPEEREKVIDVTLRCIDITEVFVSELTAGGEISEESAECLADGITGADFFRPLLASSLAGAEFSLEDDPEAGEALFGLVIECLSVEELARLGDS